MLIFSVSFQFLYMRWLSEHCWISFHVLICHLYIISDQILVHIVHPFSNWIFGFASHSSTLAWKIPWMEEPGGLQSMGSLRVGDDWVTPLSLFTFMHWWRKWQPTPVFLPGESQGRGSLVAAVYGVTQSRTRLKQLRSSRSSSSSIHSRYQGYFGYVACKFFSNSVACLVILIQRSFVNI